jgi:hypothetical protein
LVGEQPVPGIPRFEKKRIKRANWTGVSPPHSRYAFNR